MLSVLMGLALAQADPSNAWSTCLASEVERLSRGSASADAVADQAMRACSAQEQIARRQVAARGAGADPAELNRIIETMIRDTRQRMRQAAIDFRANRAAAASRPATAPVSNRSAARQKAANTDRRNEARAAARQADLSFRLFNASRTQITGFHLIGSNGQASSNWLNNGARVGAVAPNTFRPLRFRNSAACTHNARVTFAGGRTLTRRINFCGKDILYADANDMWAE